MPIKIQSDLPAVKILEKENIFVMTEKRASTQDIRPLKIAIVNLMPTKEVTETQLLRLLGKQTYLSGFALDIFAHDAIFSVDKRKKTTTESLLR